MMEVSMAGLRGRVLVSRERVKFADADPYGHLASGAYVDMIMSHRVEVLDDLIGFSILRHANLGVTFPTRNVEVSYLRPAYVGETLEIGSWIEVLGATSFEVLAILCGGTDRKARAVARMYFVTLDAKTGKPVPVPASLPSSASSDPLPDLPSAQAYRETVIGLPTRWFSPRVEGRQ